jgi:hypothetical protein
MERVVRWRGSCDGEMAALLDGLGAELHQRADRRGRGVERVDAVPLHKIPVPTGVGVGRQALEHQGGAAVAQRAVHDVRVARDPPNVGDAGEDVARPVVEGVEVGEGGPEQVARGGVHHALGFAGRARGVQQEERLLT